MNRVIFRLETGDKEGQESKTIKEEKYEVYKKKLIGSGKKIISETDEVHRRFGRVKVITLS